MSLGLACGRLTLAITWPQGLFGEEDYLVEAAQVHGIVGHSSNH